jgi:hypothetical protein
MNLKWLIILNLCLNRFIEVIQFIIELTLTVIEVKAIIHSNDFM